MAVCSHTESPFDHDRNFTFTVNDETYNGSIHFFTHYNEKPDFIEVLRNTFFQDETYGDARAKWHRNTTSFYAWVKAHMLRLAWDCRERLLHRFLHSFPNICRDFGFSVAHNRDTSGAPSQSRLWEMWNKEFTDVQREFVRTATEEALAFAREQGIPAPDPVFRPEERDISSKRSEQRLVAEKTKEVWQQAKPFVTDTFYLKRADNSVIHENAFWEQHAYMGMRENMYAQSGQHSFFIDSQRDHTPSASNHRYQIGKLTVEETRSMLHETTRMLIARARHNSELVGKLWAAIDITKGNPWTGEIERDEDDNITEDWILGYKDGEVYYQWATIQIVGYDIPLVLDAIPVKRGMKRADIVDSLLENALDLVDDIELVMMDREFDNDGVKDACDKHGVYYLNGARKRQSERATCTRLRRAGKTVHIEEETVPDGPTRKRMFLPSSTDDPDAEDMEESSEPVKGSSDVREEMREDLAELGIDLNDDDDRRGFGPVIDDLREQEANEPTVGSDEDAQTYALFETNHPSVTLNDDDSEIERIHMVERMVRRYRHRWGIENGYKQIKTFRVRTTSKRHTYRFFNFVFACVLYNVWRLVDLLVKLATEGENTTYAPRVDANQFLTVAKKYYGLDPPD
ncbi:ISH7-type transposase ISNma10 (plasmid) [Natrialba magadii ATCC 43099]|uniref:ISH7-type transposase ISNma10 n=2 Tax=Natrialba magadii (strain ATCC 43099 / DSM 3394 / CCM 3739 / CIP 104546 / IAM 13178 / JCM 8861 / NBRC 102185 / NCIMB 2190 / MS3) TaxID=547559 RepID=D3T175_NATMM|nr:transposase [Natrialba magadii]ADD07334.1 ISH7-type transposase ISNma10 [Natrialba magadii ATCC 43099]